MTGKKSVRSLATVILFIGILVLFGCGSGGGNKDNNPNNPDYTDGAPETTDSTPVPTDDTTDSVYFPGDELAPWEGGPDYYSSWPNGPSNDPDIFPINVWAQSPSNAAAYKEIDVNNYIGLYGGPTEDQLSSLTDSAIPAICNQNDIGLNSENIGIISSWMQQDEPDNAQNGTQDPVPTEEVINRYNAMVTQDSSRPVYLNFGQGVAADTWYGRGNRTNHPEDYAQYALGADILSFDIYPMNIHPRPETDAEWFKIFSNVVTQKIWYVAIGVDRLREWSNYEKPVWVWIETTNIRSNANYTLTPVHVKAEVWMAIIHGARGIGYFTHEFTSGGGYITDSGLLRDPEMKAAVGAINSQITSLASVLNTQSVSNGVITVSSDSTIPVDTMVKRSGGFTYLFAAAMRPGTTTSTFTLREFTGSTTMEVVGEDRTISADEGIFEDNFTNYAVHIYKIPNP